MLVFRSWEGKFQIQGMLGAFLIRIFALFVCGPKTV